VNLYGYVGGNPVNATDALGLWSSADESELYAMLQWWWASHYAMGKWLSEIKEEVGSDVKCAGKQIVEWAVKWDYIEDPTWWNIVGQAWVGLTPAWVAWDIRDFNYAVNTCEWWWWCSRSVSIAMIAFDPWVGDLVKAGAKKWFKSFDAFKRALGRAWDGMEWHHIVEQHAHNIAKFGPEMIHNIENVKRVPAKLNKELNKYYSRIDESVAKWIRVRDHIKTLSFEEQFEFWVKKLIEFDWGKYLK